MLTPDVNGLQLQVGDTVRVRVHWRHEKRIGIIAEIREGIATEPVFIVSLDNGGVSIPLWGFELERLP